MPSRNGKNAAFGHLRPVAELAQMMEAAEDSNSSIELRERMADIELALEDMGWYRLGYETHAELSRFGLRRLTQICRALYLKHPLINHAVDIATHYVWGQGVTMVAKSDEINKVVQAWWNLKDNRTELTGHRARMLKERELRVAGNLFFALFTDPVRGTVRVRTIIADEVESIITNPDDRRDVWYYHRRYIAPGAYDIGLAATTGSKEINEYYPDWQFKPARRVPTIKGTPVRWDSPVYHMKAGGLDNMAFGVPEIFPAIDWARAVQTDLENYATIRKALARFAFTLTVKSTGGNFAAAKKMLETTVGVLSGGGETNPPPVAGSTLLQKRDVAELQPVRTAGMQPSPDEGRRLGLMAGAGLGIPETMLWGDATLGNYATAKSLDRPTELSFLTRQQDWQDTFNDILNYVIDACARATQGSLKSKVVIDDYSGEKTIEVLNPKDRSLIDRRVDIAFPSILEHDPKDEVQAIVTAATMNGQPPNGLVDTRTIARLLLVALRVPNVDEILRATHPDEPNPPASEPTVTAPTAPAAGAPAPVTPATTPTPAAATESAIKLFEPVQSCQLDNKPGWRWGSSGKCYTYTSGDQGSSDDAKNKAYQQGYAMGQEAISAVAQLRDQLDKRVESIIAALSEQQRISSSELVTAVLDSAAASKPDLQPFVDAVLQLSARPINIEIKGARDGD